MHAFTQLLREYVTPALRPVGYVKQGNTYRLRASSGDEAIITLLASRGTGFYVNLSVIPAPFWAWQVHANPAKADRRPGDADGLWRDRVPAPAKCAADPGPWRSDRWRLNDPAKLVGCGTALAKSLRQDAIPLLNRLLRRSQFLAMFRDPACPVRAGVVGPAEIMLLVDSGPSAELERAIKAAETLDPNDYPAAGRVAKWARDRLGTRITSRKHPAMTGDSPRG